SGSGGGGSGGGGGGGSGSSGSSSSSSTSSAALTKPMLTSFSYMVQPYTPARPATPKAQESTNKKAADMSQGQGGRGRGGGRGRRWRARRPGRRGWIRAG